MSRLVILTKNEQYEFDNVPNLSTELKSICFNITKDLQNKINTLRTATNKVGFFLQYGYFKACRRFFAVSSFKPDQIKSAAKILGIPMQEINFSQYKNKILIDHQNEILKLLDFKRFDSKICQLLTKEIIQRVEQFTNPREVFFEVLDLLHRKNIEVPSYHYLAELITKHYLNYEDKLSNIVNDQLPTSNYQELERLLKLVDGQSTSNLNHFTVINQSTKPKAIQASLMLFAQIKELFNSLLPVTEKLNLSAKAREYYATWVKKAKLSQLKQITFLGKKYLHLIAFIQHQFYLRQDLCIDLFLKCIQTSKNSAIKRLEELDKLTRSERRAAIRHLSKTNRSYTNLIDEVAKIVRSPELSDQQKVQKINVLIDENDKKKSEINQAKLDLFTKSLDRMAHDKDYFEILEKGSTKLQLRVTNLVKILTFNENTSNPNLIKAINYFKNKDGNIDQHAPQEFLKEEEKQALITNKGIFRGSLYKILLFIHIGDSIKSGDLNLKHSYRYLSIKEYLIEDQIWQAQRENLIKQAGLEAFKKYEILNTLKQQLNEKYRIVNKNLLEGRNPYLSFHKKDEHIQIATPALDDPDTEYISALLKQSGYMPILKVLSEIDRIAHFEKCFKHHGIKHVKYRPRLEIFIAGIIGLGCNIGIPKMAKISSGVNENTLNNTVNWYFSKKSLLNANEQIIKVIHALILSNVFIAEQHELHSASDGYKVNVGVDSLMANYSFKYFGNEKGISIYTFIDERQILFYSLVISASEREAAYVIDGLNNNNVTKTKIHSTDTHGYTELIFATTYFLGISFAPRIKNIGKQNIYGFSSIKTYERLGYKVLPSRTIDLKLIIKHWDDILKFMVTIKLKKITASQLFKRLSSYNKDNPLYKAIKEFGRIIKSLFILTYYNDVKLRQRIEKQLSRIELSNKFSRAVFYANNGEFTEGGQEDQEIVVGCKVLIQNAIILWNYLYLSQLLTNCNDLKERTEMINMIKHGSIINWVHINLYGAFTFKRQALSPTFDMKKICALKLVS